RFVTSVCTGSLVLGAAGLLTGKRATTHWNAVDFLPAFGAIPTEGRVVRDGDVVTAGGVTSGIDFGLALVAELFGETAARTVQLALEYAPAPPFDAGTPATAGAELVAAAKVSMAGSRAEREAFLAARRA
ncbi:MAG: DJ-1/PfpI family protein, partial [Phyllobacteriaceae bacterium]|nr:DJ-1/PfpI family protein [Phyllobacteriaceae bacterium]